MHCWPFFIDQKLIFQKKDVTTSPIAILVTVVALVIVVAGIVVVQLGLSRISLDVGGHQDRGLPSHCRHM